MIREMPSLVFEVLRQDSFLNMSVFEQSEAAA